MENTLHSCTIEDGFLQHIKMPYDFVDKVVLVQNQQHVKDLEI